MTAIQPAIRTTVFLVAASLILIVVLACSEQEEPFAVGDRATVTPTPTDAEQAQAEAAATPTATVVPLPTSVPVSLPTSVPAPTAVPTPTEVLPTPAPTATTLPAALSVTTPTTSAAPSPTPASAATGPPEPTATPVPAPTEAPTPSVPPTRTPVPLPADYDRTESGPPRDELIKIAQWGDNRLKLSNWVAGYIIAHGFDYPVLVIDTNPDDYKEALPHSDIDVVLEADPEWAQPYVDAGVLVLLGSLSSANPDTVIAVNASVWQRVPEVGKFFEEYEWDGDVLTTESKKIRGGRIPVAENVIGVSFLKENKPVWSAWVDAATIAAIESAIADGSLSICRAFEVRMAFNRPVRVCKDNPTLRSSN